ncbi:hypothetical protein U1Q18_027722 [Sarracenia purpurea var. burkii]
MILSQRNAPKVGTQTKKENKATTVSSTIDKLKASNFLSSLLKIEYKSRYEGDLVTKCYFAKHELVWETNPQPRKHTLWRAASDFTWDRTMSRERIRQNLRFSHQPKLADLPIRPAELVDLPR